MLRMEAIADASFALMRELMRFGIATAAMIKITITTISNSISENPLCLRLIYSKLQVYARDFLPQASICPTKG
jgi:hypothetical protein